jgi:adenine-specific DNA methylase
MGRGERGPRHQSTRRRPLAACRAMLLASLLPNACDAHRPAQFTNTMNALADA